MNIYFEKLNTPFETIPFSKVKNEDFLPALEKAIEVARERVSELKKVETPTFENFLVPLLNCDKELSLVSGVFFNLYSAHKHDDMQEISQKFSPTLTKFYNDISLDQELFEKIKMLHDQIDELKLGTEEKTILEKEYKGFVRNGALLSEEEKDKIRKIDEQLSKLSLNFGDNALAARNAYVLELSDEDVKGMPESFLDASKAVAKEKGLKEGQYAVTMDPTLYIPFMTYCQNRDLREKVQKDRSRLAVDGDHGNQENIQEMLKLREQRAKILGFENHAEFVLAERMAKNPGTVFEFMDNIIAPAKSKANEELSEVEKFAKEVDGIEDFQSWDYGYYTEKLKKKKFDFDDEVLRPYFKLENVIDGAFSVASKLYQLTFKENSEIEKYHSDVKVFEVFEENGNEPIGILYADFFPRATKRAGAWMTEFKSQSKDQIPHVMIVCNFTKSTDSKPSLLTLNEVLTLFHEFGHALHGLLSKCKYEAVSGTSVYWDFVELPSQILENWVFEKECLDLFAKHYETGELIPQDLVKKISDSRKFHEGMATMRQLSFATLDMVLHTTPAKEVKDVVEFEDRVLDQFRLFPKTEDKNSMACTFGHIFSGGYSAGYYSYKWAEVLDADAFEHFKKHGIFNEEVAKKFKTEVLSRGGSEHPEILYKRFRGKAPSVDALMKRAGLN